ncbi:unnamed protein product [Blepharisma stoltei]|uniref:Uncharacterized protein n=1 Tax=Blepharisma stoltei TaxID=1481888 RepID=A0AAU9K078_9CILI|nr:unnamed protein product [Blepharisma stoltei]
MRFAMVLISRLKQGFIFLLMLALVCYLIQIQPALYEYQDFSPSEPLVNMFKTQPYLSFEWYPNSDYQKHKNVSFSIDATDNLNKYRAHGFCIPETWGYSVEEANTYFPNVTYPKCSVLNSNTKGEVFLDTEENLLEIICPQGFQGRYILGNVTNQKLVYRTEGKWIPKNYKGPVELNGYEEYVIASCKKEGPMDLAQMRPRYNKTAHKLAQNKWIEAKNSVNQAHSEPLHIVHLVLDSFSRRHFYRKLPKTVALLKEIYQSNLYHIEDFLVYNIRGPGSVQNQIQILGNQWINQNQKYVQKDLVGENAIWNILSQFGYVSLLGIESCNNEFALSLGRQPNVTHSINEFYCGAQNYCQYHTEKEFSEQRCIGKQMSHYYTFEYAKEFRELYKDINQWIYLHLDAAHEYTGQHAATLDDDLEDFIRNVTSPYTLIVIEGDHGMRYGEWFTKIQGFMEYRLPALFFLIPHEIMADYDYSYSKLSLNSERLVTKQDVRSTVLSIAHGWMGRFFSDDFDAVFLLKWEVDQWRTCWDAGISNWLCSCNEFYTYDKLKFDSEYEENEFKELAEYLAEESVFTMKERLYASVSRNSICKDFSLGDIISVHYLRIYKTKFMLKIVFSVEEKPTVKFEVLVFVASDFLYGVDESSYPIQAVYLKSRKAMFRIQYINRLDKYEGCEDQAIKIGANPQYCLCE